MIDHNEQARQELSDAVTDTLTNQVLNIEEEGDNLTDYYVAMTLLLQACQDHLDEAEEAVLAADSEPHGEVDAETAMELYKQASEIVQLGGHLARKMRAGEPIDLIGDSSD